MADQEQNQGTSEKEETTNLCAFYEIDSRSFISLIFSPQYGSLKGIIKDGGGYFTSDVTRETSATFPTGLNTAWQILKETYKVNRKQIVQAATETHGMAIALRDQRTKNLIKEYKTKSHRAYKLGDTDALSTIEEKSSILKYVKPVEAHTSVARSTMLEDLLGLLSMASGLRVAQQSIYLSVISVVNDEATKELASKHLSQDVVKYWAHIENRISALSAKTFGNVAST